jgi:hypothetical protein
VSSIATSHAVVHHGRRWALMGAALALAVTGLVILIVALSSGGGHSSSGGALRVLPQSQSQSVTPNIERQTPGARP